MWPYVRRPSFGMGVNYKFQTLGVAVVLVVKLDPQAVGVPRNQDPTRVFDFGVDSREVFCLRAKTSALKRGPRKVRLLSASNAHPTFVPPDY